MSTTSIETIIQLLLKGDKHGFSMLYDQYSESLYGVLLKMVNDESLAQDILQESFIKIWEKGHLYDPAKASLFTWIYQITRRTAIDKLRQVKNQRNLKVQIATANVYKSNTTELKPEHLDIPVILEKIEEKYRKVIYALFFLGMTQEEASEALEIPLGTVKSRLKIGLRELKKFYFFNPICFLIVLVEYIQYHL